MMRTEDSENGEVTAEKGRGWLRKKSDFCPEVPAQPPKTIAQKQGYDQSARQSPGREMLPRNRKRWWEVTESYAGGQEELRSEAL